MIKKGYSLLTEDDPCPVDEGNLKMCLDSIVPYLVKLCPPGVRGRAGVLHAAEWIERLARTVREQRKNIVQLEKKLAKTRESPTNGPIGAHGSGYPRIAADGARHVG